LSRRVEFYVGQYNREKLAREPKSDDPAGATCVPCGRILMIEDDELPELDIFIAEHLPHGEVHLVTEGPEGVFTGRGRLRRPC
jgi:hypothetical protein